ncbi:MAG TPA: glycosyltransferase family 4 protein [Planctomycetota bacterium]|nr:glycosyltransferase family 4 protein [Planctomycetota bacterium]
MRILFVSPYLPFPPDHGGRIRSHALLGFLAAEHEVHLLALAGGGDEPSRAAELARLVRSVEVLPAAPPRSRGRKLVRWLAGLSDLAERSWGPEAKARVHEALRSPFDVVFADSTWTLPPLLEGAGPRLLLHLQNLESCVLGRGGGDGNSPSARVSRALEARFLGALEGRAAARARLTVVVSEEDRARLLDLAPSARVEVVPNSVDLDRLPLLPPPDLSRPMVLFVGSLDYPPNREAARRLLREHLPALRASLPNLRCRIVGRDATGEIAALARAAGAEAAGYVPDLLPHYREATALYAPIASGGGSRLKVLEAFALGRPVLTTAVGAEGLSARPGEHFLRVENPPEGVEALRKVVANGLGPVVAAARRHVEERFTHAIVGREVRRTIRESFDVSPRA